MAADHDDDLDVSFRTVSGWINALEEENAVVEAGRTESNAVKYRTTPPSGD